MNPCNHSGSCILAAAVKTASAMETDCRPIPSRAVPSARLRSPPSDAPARSVHLPRRLGRGSSGQGQGRSTRPDDPRGTTLAVNCANRSSSVSQSALRTINILPRISILYHQFSMTCVCMQRPQASKWVCAETRAMS